MLLPLSVLWYVLNSILMVCLSNRILFLKDLVFGYVLLTVLRVRKIGLLTLQFYFFPFLVRSIDKNIIVSPSSFVASDKQDLLKRASSSPIHVHIVRVLPDISHLSAQFEGYADST